MPPPGRVVIGDRDHRAVDGECPSTEAVRPAVAHAGFGAEQCCRVRPQERHAVATCIGRRAGVLLEVLVSIAVFAAAAAVLLGLARDSLEALGRAEGRELAVDAARDAMARLATGELSLADLRAGRIEPTEPGRVDGDAPGSLLGARFRIDVRTQRSPFRGLILVEISVFDASAAGDAAALCTLRQLVTVRRSSTEDADDGDTAQEPGDEEVEP